MRSNKILRTRRALGLSFGGAAALSMLALGFGAQADQLPVRDTVCHEDRKPAVVYFATHAIPHPFWSIVIKGAEEGARDACLEMKWTQDVEFSPTTTVERQEMAIAEDPDVLVITAVEPKMQQRTIQRARDKGIPIIAINVEDPGPDQGGLDYLVYIGGDEEKGGYAAANQIVTRGVEPKRAACFNSFPGHVGLEARCKGFTDRMREAGVETDTLDVSGGPANAEGAISAYLIANEDANAFFTVSPGPENYEVAHRLLGEHRPDGSSLTTFDLTPYILENIKNGTTLAAIDQQPYLQGYLASILARTYFDWGAIPGGDILTGPGVVNSDNVEVVISGAAAGRR
jgi:simple sugar transport system substrate-binding protein